MWKSLLLYTRRPKTNSFQNVVQSMLCYARRPKTEHVSSKTNCFNGLGSCCYETNSFFTCLCRLVRKPCFDVLGLLLMKQCRMALSAFVETMFAFMFLLMSVCRWGASLASLRSARLAPFELWRSCSRSCSYSCQSHVCVKGGASLGAICTLKIMMVCVCICLYV